MERRERCHKTRTAPAALFTTVAQGSREAEHHKGKVPLAPAASSQAKADRVVTQKAGQVQKGAGEAAQQGSKAAVDAARRLDRTTRHGQNARARPTLGNLRP
jgi:hypothetical protein